MTSRTPSDPVRELAFQQGNDSTSNLRKAAGVRSTIMTTFKPTYAFTTTTPSPNIPENRGRGCRRNATVSARATLRSFHVPPEFHHDY